MPRITPIERKKFEKFLEYVGCNLKRQKGDHLIYGRFDLKRPVVITTDKEVPVFIIRNNLRTLNIGPEEYLEILKKL
jgi:predicted RNA binding protein YcfA (HicA-like mRNA interferase family)